MIFTPKNNVHFPQPKWGTKKYQRGVLHPAGFWHAAGGVAPTVSALANGDFNTSSLFSVWVGVVFDTDGEEYELNPNGSRTATIGTWLDSGTSSQVWVVHNRTGGTQTKFDNKTNGVRYNINVDQEFNINDTNQNGTAESIIGTFSFYDAASGGNLLQTTASATYTANYLTNMCPLCCFTPDTLISMARGIQVPIGSVRVGDTILTADGSEEVTEVITRTNRPMVRITFSDGRFVDASEDHPFDVKGEPKSLNHFGTEYKDLGLPAQLRIGDQVTTDVGTVTIRKIEGLEYPDTVYTFANSKFYANGLLVY